MKENDLESGDGFDLPQDGMLGSVPGFIKGVILNLIVLPVMLGGVFGYLNYRGSNLLSSALEAGWISFILSGFLCLIGSLFAIWFARRSYSSGNGLKIPLFIAFVVCLWVPLIVTSVIYFLN